MPDKGYVYILTNPSMPGLVKIGKTTRDVEQRANELYSSGVPLPFHVEHHVISPDCSELELWMHEVLDEFRVSDNREFFKVSVDMAIKSLDNCLKEQVDTLVEEYLSGFVVTWGPATVCEADMALLSSDAGVGIYDIAGAMGEMTLDEISPSLNRYLDKQAARIAARGIDAKEDDE